MSFGFQVSVFGFEGCAVRTFDLAPQEGGVPGVLPRATILLPLRGAELALFRPENAKEVRA